jgi:hypothetical protein
VSEIDRRTVLAGVGAMAAAALLPTAAAAALPAAEVIDPEIERLRIWVGQVFRGLRAEGIAVVRPPNGGGGALIFWLQNDDDLTSMQLVELSEDVFL